MQRNKTLVFTCNPNAQQSPHWHGTTFNGAVRIFRSGFQISSLEYVRDTSECPHGDVYFATQAIANGYMCREPFRELLIFECECIVTKMKLKKTSKKQNKGHIAMGRGFASRMYVRMWDPNKGCAYTYQWDRMLRIYGREIAEQVCGKESMGGEIAYTLDEEPSEEVRRAVLRDAPTSTLSMASTAIRNPDAIDRPPKFDKTMPCFMEGVDRCLNHEECLSLIHISEPTRPY